MPLSSFYDAFRVSPWLDDLSRSALVDGTIKSYVERGIRGITSNPTIFAKAVQQSDIYHGPIKSLRNQGLDNEAVYWRLAVEDTQMAADLLEPVYTASKGQDGFVSLEISPRLSSDAQSSIRQATELWQQVARPNLMIKVPATEASLPVIHELISLGINVNTTLIFSLSRYLAVINAYLSGLEQREPRSNPATGVASFFVSRVDSAVDSLLDQIGSDAAHNLKGKAAIAQARAAYGLFLETFHPLSDRWQKLNGHGADVQRLLWASTSTKNPDYDTLMYVQGLLTPRSVNTLPGATIAALEAADSKTWRAVDEPAILAAHETLASLKLVGVDMLSVTERLEQEGLEKFNASYDEILNSIASVN